MWRAAVLRRPRRARSHSMALCTPRRFVIAMSALPTGCLCVCVCVCVCARARARACTNAWLRTHAYAQLACQCACASAHRQRSTNERARAHTHTHTTHTHTHSLSPSLSLSLSLSLYLSLTATRHNTCHRISADAHSPGRFEVFAVRLDVAVGPQIRDPKPVDVRAREF